MSLSPTLYLSIFQFLCISLSTIIISFLLIHSFFPLHRCFPFFSSTLCLPAISYFYFIHPLSSQYNSLSFFSLSFAKYLSLSFSSLFMLLETSVCMCESTLQTEREKGGLFPLVQEPPGDIHTLLLPLLSLIDISLSSFSFTPSTDYQV